MDFNIFEYLPTAVVERFNKREAENKHTEAMMGVAHHLGYLDLYEVLVKIDDIHTWMGYMHLDLYNFRQSIWGKITKRYKDNLKHRE